MKIVFDCRYTRIGRHDGISRFTASLVSELAKLHDVTMLINDRAQLDMLPDLPWAMASAPTSVREPLVALQVNRLHPDIVFTPMQTMGSIGRRYRLVLTVHDLIYYRNRTPPRDLPAFVRGLWRLYHLSWWPQRMLLNRSDTVVAVSETTRSLIAEHRLTRKPVRVVTNAPEVPAGVPTTPRDAPSSKALVYMGSFMPYKNVETLAKAVAELPEYELHLMSRVGDADRARLTAAAPTARLVFHNGASDEEYFGLLREATALVTASFDEGFGIPLVEAMSVGTPVVVSDIPIFREIGADAAVYADPHDPSSFADAVRGLEATGEWARASALSVEAASRYTWARSATSLLEVLNEVAGQARTQETAGS
ncbi:glycosyltransferase family 4 protein [Planctomonas sp. JC2975]|uniref:glycosyltransferase family 4 protein n=1 Tax=Planctomonas sp. JC2975 TaxID=2729626 RepID=UPI0014757D16|nr:glycosyltransferase family 1 protein [Planctomonas sp. JC2975]NNC10480.1 glycosyltransferase family 4 protein [Planctomonas sp. JC2975]